MKNCSKCIFYKCCKNAGNNPRKCAYYEENMAWIRGYLRDHNLWEKEYELKNPTEEFLGYVLKLKQEDNVKRAKENLCIIGIIILCIATNVAFCAGTAYRWSTNYLFALLCVACVVVLFHVLKAMLSFFKYVFNNMLIVVKKG